MKLKTILVVLFLPSLSMAAVMQENSIDVVSSYQAPASLAIDVGDLIYHDGDEARPASSQSDQSTETLNQVEFAQNFVGIAKSSRDVSVAVAGTVNVQTQGYATLTCVSSTFEIGDYVGADEADSGTALEDQQVKKVTDYSRAIGIVVVRYSEATTTVVVQLVSGLDRDPNTFGTVREEDRAITGFSGAADTAGVDVYVQTQDGGAASADTAGVVAGALEIRAGDGSAGGAHSSNNPAGGAGAKLTVTSGTGGTSGSGGSGNGGTGGETEINAGAGGAIGTSGTGTAGTGGLVDVNGGVAGASVADIAGGVGGAIDLDAGAGSDGGAHTANNPAGGAGGAVTVNAGTGGTGGSGGSGNGGAGGALTLTAGTGGASGAGGTGTPGAGGTASVVAGTAGTAAADTSGGGGGSIAITAAAGAAGGAHTANNPDGGAGGSITLTPGSGGAAGDGGSGVAGAPGHVVVSGGVLRFSVQTIDMNNDPVTTTLVPGTPTGTLLTGNILYVDANSGATENLLLPPEGDCTGLFLIIENTGGETINVQNDAGGAVVTLETANVALCTCNGTSWDGTVSVP